MTRRRWCCGRPAVHKLSDPAKDVNARATENPGTPAAAKPKKTTLPVMLAVKTRPSPRTLTVSISPVVTVNTTRTLGNGSGLLGVVMMEVSLSTLASGALEDRLVVAPAPARGDIDKHKARVLVRREYERGLRVNAPLIFGWITARRPRRARLR